MKDIKNAPSDEQLDALMEAAAIVARQRFDEARARLMLQLQNEIDKACP